MGGRLGRAGAIQEYVGDSEIYVGSRGSCSNPDSTLRVGGLAASGGSSGPAAVWKGARDAPGAIQKYVGDLSQKCQSSRWSSFDPVLTLGVGGLAAWGGAGGPATAWEDAWDAPGPQFEGFVEDCVRRRLGKYRQPAHPMRLSMEEAAALFKKVRRVIVDTERKARALGPPGVPVSRRGRRLIVHVKCCKAYALGAPDAYLVGRPAALPKNVCRVGFDTERKVRAPRQLPGAPLVENPATPVKIVRQDSHSCVPMTPSARC